MPENVPDVEVPDDPADDQYPDPSLFANADDDDQPDEDGDDL